MRVRDLLPEDQNEEQRVSLLQRACFSVGAGARRLTTKINNEDAAAAAFTHAH